MEATTVDAPFLQDVITYAFVLNFKRAGAANTQPVRDQLFADIEIVRETLRDDYTLSDTVEDTRVSEVIVQSVRDGSDVYLVSSIEVEAIV